MSIRWITETLGTGPANEALQLEAVEVVDVRDLVDKGGNLADAVREKIETGVKNLRNNRRTVICCDYGISRSNAVAVGVLALHEGLDFEVALQRVQNATGENEIKLAPLSIVKKAVNRHIEHSKKPGSKTCLLTGGRGFVGQVLVKALSGIAEVVAPGREEIDLESGNTRLATLASLREVDCIIHLATPRIYTSNRALGTTLTMLRNVAEVCTNLGIRLIYTSGWEVYSAYRGTVFADESLPLYPKGPYGEAKFLAERLLDEYVNRGRLKSCILRAGPLYGSSSDRPKFIFNFAEKARKGQPIVTHRYKNGNPALDLMHVGDFVRALVSVVERDIVGEFNLGTGVLTDTSEVAACIRRLLKSDSEISSVSIDSYVASIAMDWQRASDQLGWRPTISLEDGLRSLLAQGGLRNGTD